MRENLKKGVSGFQKPKKVSGSVPKTLKRFFKDDSISFTYPFEIDDIFSKKFCLKKLKETNQSCDHSQQGTTSVILFSVFFSHMNFYFLMRLNCDKSCSSLDPLRFVLSLKYFFILIDWILFNETRLHLQIQKNSS
jgi:hypothetical protein